MKKNALEGTHIVETPEDFPFKIYFDNDIGGRNYTFYDKEKIKKNPDDVSAAIDSSFMSLYDALNLIAEWFEKQSIKNKR